MTDTRRALRLAAAGVAWCGLFLAAMGFVAATLPEWPA